MKAVIIAKNMILLVIILVMFYLSIILVRNGEIHEDVFVVMEDFFPYLIVGYAFLKITQEVGSVKRREERK